MQHLQELGLKLKKDTILVWAKFMLGKTSISDWEIAYNHSAITDNSQTIPAYTLQDVLDALPKEIRYENKRCWLSIDLANEKIEYYNENAIDERYSVHYSVHFEFYRSSSLIDAACSMLWWAIKNKFVETNKKE